MPDQRAPVTAMPAAPEVGDLVLDGVLASHLDAAQRRRLAEARVGIAGAGGLGSNCAVLLARSGVIRLTIADHDVVSLSNLNRQFYWPRHVGRPKVDALGEILRGLNPAIRPDLRRERLSAENVAAVFAGCSVVVEAVDDARIKKELVEALLRAGHVVVSASGMAGWGGPPMTTRRIGSRLIVVGDLLSEVTPDRPALAPRVVMAAALEADAVLCCILDGECGESR